MNDSKLHMNYLFWDVIAMIAILFGLSGCADQNRQDKNIATYTWPQEEILQQLSEQKQEINTLKKDMTFVDSNAKVGYLS
ncbi:MAG: hypothetical protein GY820_47785 [Gammaproteobacteria bacterium]|nr:hypothetical protein [Gammaproteobacteria bacterium]